MTDFPKYIIDNYALILNNVCNLIAALCFLNFAHGKKDKHRSIVVESKA
jgi:hypothetical protein